jgi:hypothetical protein
MPTFTDASLIAGAAGLLLGALLSGKDSPARRLTLGTVAFLALDGAVLIRYTDVTVLLVALVTVLALRRVCSLTRATLLSWIGVVVLFALGDLELNRVLYGGYFTTGYPSGLINFGTSAILPNLERMPLFLIESLPMVLLAVAALVWVISLLVNHQASDVNASTKVHVRRDSLVVLILAAGWFSVWGLYATYTWTVSQTLGSVIPIHVVRFYVPALGLVTLLAAWLLTRLPRKLGVGVLVLLAGLGIWSYVTPSNHAIAGSARVALRRTSADAKIVTVTRDRPATSLTLEKFS